MSSHRIDILPILLSDNILQLQIQSFNFQPLVKKYFTNDELTRLTGNLENRLGKSLDISSGDASDRDTAVLGSVDGVLLGKDIHLFGRETSVCEHTNLDSRILAWKQKEKEQ